MDYKFRCKCPITSAIDILGDKWILVIIKQMLIEDSMTFKDFIESDEAIAKNILSSKLKCLEEIRINARMRAYKISKGNWCITNIDCISNSICSGVYYTYITNNIDNI